MSACLWVTPKGQRVICLDNKPRSNVILDELRAETNEGNEVPIPVTQVSTPLVVRTQEPRVPRHSGRVVTQPEHFIGLGEVLEDPETDPSNYNEVV